MATRRRPPSAERAEGTETSRVPRGGLWVVSLCVGVNRWRPLDWVGSHAKADEIADHYRRKCRRVAVHRDGQSPRERTAPLLPASYRAPERDPDQEDPQNTAPCRDLLLAKNVSHSDARELQRWWSRRGHVYLREAMAAPFRKGRFSVWLQR